MSAQHPRAVLVVWLLAPVLAAGATSAQQPLTAKLDPSGLVHLLKGDVELATIELNAHGPDWTHAPQETATAQASQLPDGSGTRFDGTLPVANAAGAAIRYTETVRALGQGLQLEYDLSVTGALRLNGLQLSLNLPVAHYAGKDVTIPQQEGDPEVVALPQEQTGDRFQLWYGEGAKIEIARDTEDAITVELRAPTDVVVQDLRRWEHDIYEIRFPAIMEDGGRDVAAEDRFHLDFSIALPVQVKLQGP